MTTLQDLEQRVDQLEQRNKRVELGKSWEISSARKIIILLSTYLVIGLYLNAIGTVDAWIHAIVPAIGFLLSTLSLDIFKNLWVKYRLKK